MSGLKLKTVWEAYKAATYKADWAHEVRLNAIRCGDKYTIYSATRVHNRRSAQASKFEKYIVDHLEWWDSLSRGDNISISVAEPLDWSMGSGPETDYREIFIVQRAEMVVLRDSYDKETALYGIYQANVDTLDFLLGGGE